MTTPYPSQFATQIAAGLSGLRNDDGVDSCFRRNDMKREDNNDEVGLSVQITE